MNTKKFLVGGIVGGVVYLLLGWLVYGNLLMDYMQKNSMPGVNRPQADMVWWAMIVGHLALGFLLSYVLARTNTSTLTGGLGTGLMIGLLMSLGFDCIMYGWSNILNTNSMLADIGAFTAISAVTGAVIVLVNGMISSSSAKV